MPTRAEIVAEALTYKGVPFRHQGRSRELGVDCAGLVECVGVKFGLLVPGPTNYRRLPNGNRTMIPELSKQLDRIEVDSIMPADVPVFWISSPDRPQHIGIITPAGLVHSYYTVGKVVEQSLGEYWMSRIHSVYRFRGIE